MFETPWPCQLRRQAGKPQGYQITGLGPLLRGLAGGGHVFEMARVAADCVIELRVLPTVGVREGGDGKGVGAGGCGAEQPEAANDGSTDWLFMVSYALHRMRMRLHA